LMDKEYKAHYFPCNTRLKNCFVNVAVLTIVTIVTIVTILDITSCVPRSGEIKCFIFQMVMEFTIFSFCRKNMTINIHKSVCPVCLQIFPYK